MEMHEPVFLQHAQAIKQRPDKMGQFCVGLSYDAAESMTFYLGGSLLYYFDGAEAGAACRGVVLLPGCEASVIDAAAGDVGGAASFELTAGEQWSMVLTAPDGETLLDWAVALSPFLGAERSRGSSSAMAHGRMSLASAAATVAEEPAAGAEEGGAEEGAEGSERRGRMSLQRYSVVGQAGLLQEGGGGGESGAGGGGPGGGVDGSLPSVASSASLFSQVSLADIQSGRKDTAYSRAGSIQRAGSIAPSVGFSRRGSTNMKMTSAAEAATRSATVMASMDKIYGAEVTFLKQSQLPRERDGFHWRRDAEPSSANSSSRTSAGAAATFLAVDPEPNEEMLQGVMHDSPLLHRQLEDADAAAQKLVKSRKLEKAVASFLGGTRQSVDLLETLATEVDVEGSDAAAAIGDGSATQVQAWISSWCTLLREMQILQSVSLRLLQMGFLEPLNEQRRRAKEAHEAKKRYDAARVKYASILQRYLGMRKTTAPEKLLELEQQLATLKSTLTEFARVAQSKLMMVEACSGLDFLERLNDFMCIHQSYFRHGWQMLQAKEPQMRYLRARIQSARSQLGTRERATQLRFEALRLEHDQKVSDPDALEQTSAAQGVGLRREGYLLKRDFKNNFLNPRRREWKRRYFVVEEGKLFYRRSAAHDAKPKGEIDLKLTTVRMPQSEKRFCFELVCAHPSMTYLLQAENEADRSEWIGAIQCTTAHLLGISMPGSGGGHGGDDGVYTMPGMALLTAAPGNGVCADCGTADPEWASINLGITLCLQCSGVHRSLGVHITKVRSLAMDEWGEARLQCMALLGNELSNRVWDPDGTARPATDALREERELYIRGKYEGRRFLGPPLISGGATGKPEQQLLTLAKLGEMDRAHAEQLLGLMARGRLDFNATDENGRTALHGCSEAGNAAILEFLIENGADPHICDRNGQAPLHLASANDRGLCVEALLSHGADAATPDAAGRTAAGLARGKECAALLPQPSSSEPAVDDASAATAAAVTSGTSASGGDASAAPSLPPPPPPDTSPGANKAVAKFKFSSQRADELSFQKGDTALILRKGTSGWWEAIINGERGLVPGNYFTMESAAPPSDDDDSD